MAPNVQTWDFLLEAEQYIASHIIPGHGQVPFNRKSARAVLELLQNRFRLRVYEYDHRSGHGPGCKAHHLPRAENVRENVETGPCCFFPKVAL
jgi:hypothetical protein